jgi:hypothetical protein
MTGFVSLYQSDGSQSPDQSGVTISVQGTSLSTTTDSTGHWTINGLNQGSYTVIYTKPGYGMSEQQDVQFVGGGTDFLGTTTMAQAPTFSVALDPLQTIADSNGINVTYAPSKDTSGSDIIVVIVVGSESDVSATDPTKYLYANLSVSNGEENSVPIAKTTLRGLGFMSGKTAYIVAYPLCDLIQSHNGYNDEEYYSSYLDVGTGRVAYTSVGAPSNVIALTVP